MADLERGGGAGLAQWMFTRPDGSQVLVDVWLTHTSDGSRIDGLSMAERDRRGDVWGPPLEGVKC